MSERPEEIAPPQAGSLDSPDIGQRTQGQHGEELTRFVQLLTESQDHLKAHLLSALGNFDDAQELLQRTNLTLWRNAHKFRPEAPFMPWAVTLAKYELMSFYRDRSRDRHVFSEEVAIMMLESSASKLNEVSDTQSALRRCIETLPYKSQELLRLRYDSDHSIRTIATRMSKTEEAVRTSLLRIRRSLESCVDKRLNSGSF